VKTTGAKIAKFGLKVYQSVTAVVAKVAGFIPVIGKPLGRAIAGVSKVAGVISDHIHAKLSAKLEKGMNVMNKANKIMGYIPRRRDLSEEETFQQRDISEAYFEERDDNALEIREDKIHTQLPKKLVKETDVMDKPDKVMDCTPRRRDFSEAFQQRDINEAYYFEERDDNALENREESYLDAYERDIFDGDTYY
jgi:hypothetical protein